MQLDRMDIIHIFKSAFIVGTPYMVSEISILQADAIYGVPTNAAYTLFMSNQYSFNHNHGIDCCRGDLWLFAANIGNLS